MIANSAGVPRGFSLPELLLALALTSGVLLLVLAPIDGGLRLAFVQPEVADLDQRLRVATSTLRAALERAGTGLPVGEAPGPLSRRWPAIFPHRRGADGVDGALSAFADRLTVISAASDAASPALSVAMAGPSSPVGFLTGFPCPPADPRCGFRVGDEAAVDDSFGHVDLFRVTAAEAGVLGHHPLALSRPYAPGGRARVIELDVRHFRFDPGRRQLRAGAGGTSESPLLDDVVAFQVEYVGDARPPVMPRPPPGTSTCLFDEHGAPRLPHMASATGDLVALTLGQLADGPVCGSGAGAYDADLLRVRRIRIRLRLGATVGRGGGLRSALDAAAEGREVVVDVAPRNVQWPG